MPFSFGKICHFDFMKLIVGNVTIRSGVAPTYEQGDSQAAATGDKAAE